MNKEEAKKIVGRGGYVAPMYRALKLHRWHNTPEEERRLQACCVLLNKPYIPLK